MTIARSLTQQAFDAKCERVRAKRDREAALAVSLDFLAVASTAFVTMDIFQLVGVPIAAIFALTLPAAIFFTIIGATLLCGIVCAIYLIRESLSRREAEVALMIAQRNLENEKTAKLSELKNTLKVFLAANDDKQAQALYQRILQEHDYQKVVTEINAYFTNRQNQRLADILLPGPTASQNTNLPSVPAPHYMLGNIISFFSGVGFVLGISASIIGVSALSAMILTPPGLIVLGVVALLAIGVGALMAYSDYRSKQKQQLKMEALEEKNRSISESCHFLEATITKVKWEIDHIQTVNKYASRPATPRPSLARDVESLPMPNINSSSVVDTPMTEEATRLSLRQ